MTNTIWRHSKTGNLYTVLAVAIYCGKWDIDGMVRDGTECDAGFPEGTELVVYIGHYNNPRGNRIYVRPLSEWEELVNVDVEVVPRFVRAM